ncbi:tRNA-uridine aminocarboxypropyltransferase [Vibrio sinaloensis]|uniref:tRNA-uridine aminocarboxypropyltransferase n=1 Tax=Photobacterium sp. (strain ATCC 43367) TaxID=379097 RepID=UPI00204E5AD6|nr:tRNA-uridine aminocarboxypropyltransferase [Vibrio sinaloensis]UPQ89216.1 DTW domain-containing protein [Vibrio sinaloensis]
MRIHAFHRLYQHRLAQSTKPFIARGSKVERCLYCQVAKSNCLCDYQPDIDSDIAVMLLLSDNEVFKPSNTGRLILDTVKEGYAFQWHRTEPDPEMLALVSNPSYQPIVIFPDEYVEDEQRLIPVDSIGPQGKKPLLIFIDGSWREARRIFRKSPYLDGLPVLSVEPESVSRYVMRRSDNAQHLATAEVAALVFDQMGEQHLSATLAAWFDVFKESYLHSKSRSKSDQQRPVLQAFIEATETRSRSSN